MRTKKRKHVIKSGLGSLFSRKSSTPFHETEAIWDDKNQNYKTWIIIWRGSLIVNWKKPQVSSFIEMERKQVMTSSQFVKSRTASLECSSFRINKKRVEHIFVQNEGFMRELKKNKKCKVDGQTGARLRRSQHGTFTHTPNSASLSVMLVRLDACLSWKRNENNFFLFL